MIKYLVVIGVIWAVYYFFIKKKPITNQKNKYSRQKETQYSSDMQKCETCGIYTEVDESFLNSNKYYCSKECANKG